MVPDKINSVVRTTPDAPKRVFSFVCLSSDIPNLPTITDGCGTGSVAYVQDTGKVYMYHEDNGWAEFQAAGGGITPEGSVTITENGTVDVTNYAEAVVNVPQPEGSINITANGTYDVTDYAEAVVTNSAATEWRSRCNDLLSGDNINIPELTTIKDKCFSGQTITTAVFPDVTTVGKGIFSNCCDLTTVDLRLCDTIPASTFDNCVSLTDVNIPRAVTICSSAFYYASALATLSLPVVEEIEGGAFVGTSSLKSVDFGSSLRIIGDEAFYSGGLQTLSLPATVTSIGERAFYGITSLVSASFHGVPETIASNAFQGCTGLRNIYVPWAQGEVTGAPWGATNATIHYETA